MSTQQFPFGNFDISKMMKDFKFPGMDGDFTKLMQDFKMTGMPMDDLMGAHKKNLEALTNANKVCFDGAQAVAQRQSEIFKQSMDELTKASRDLMAQGKPEEKFAKQADLLKEGFEKTFSNMREMAEIMTKANNEALDLINNRVGEAMDEFKAIVQKKTDK